MLFKTNNRFIPLLAAFLVLSGCASNSEPAAMVTQSGEVLKGTFSGSVNPFAMEATGTVQLTDGRLTCSGTEVAQIVSSIPLTCSDTRKGVVAFDHTSSSAAKVIFSDGTVANFVYGDAAKAF